MNLTWPQPDWGDIQPTDDLITWLRRTCPDFTWNGDGSGENIGGYLTSEYEPAAPHWTARLTQTEWKRIYNPLSTPPPIWPGDDYVDYGETVVLTDSAIIGGAMDGIRLSVIAVGPRTGKWAVEPFESFYRAGYIIFLSGEGLAEAVQYIGPNDAVYCRQSMRVAASVVVKLTGASQVAVQPWRLKQP